MSDLSERIRRLEALNRGPLRHAPPPEPADGAEGAPPSPAGALRILRSPLPGPCGLPSARPAPVPAARGPLRLEEEEPGQEVLLPQSGKAYLIARHVSLLEAWCPPLCIAFRTCLQSDGSAVRTRLEALCGTECVAPEEVIFLDLETAGLSAAPVFLIGTMVWEGEGLVVRQYLARDYSEEAAILALSAEAWAGRRLLVSFNGKSFDLPFLRTRAMVHGVRFLPEPAHLDLLPESRRAWGRRMPNCKLKTLERFVCGRHRDGDIPGAEIPDAYHAFVRTRDATQMVQILRHNVLDLVTLSDLLTRLPPTG